jgi:hypothetical protein
VRGSEGERRLKNLFQIQATGALQRPSSPAASARLVINSWVQKSRDGFAPLANLEPTSRYYLHSHVSPLFYRLPNVSSGAASTAFATEIAKWLADANVPSVDVQVLLVTDPDYITVADQDRVQTLTLNLDKIRKSLAARSSQVISGKTIEDSLRRVADPDFVFGKLGSPFAISTTGKIGGSVLGLVFWVDGLKPVDEVMIPVCISRSAARPATCETTSFDSVLKGIDSFRLMTSGGKQSRPDAALHFFELDSGSLLGVFRDNRWPPNEFRQWKLAGGLSDIDQYFRATMDQALNQKLPNEQALIDGGFGLYNMLFPPAGDQLGRQTFTNFVTPFTAEVPFSPPLKSLFVRTSARRPLSAPLPLTLLNTEPSSPADRLLGFHLRIEQPLVSQEYANAGACISNWVAFTPARTGGLSEPWSRLSNVLPRWQSAPQDRDPVSWFREWVGGGVSDAPTALFTFSHHDNDSLSLEDDMSNRITSLGVARRFTSPSVAVINGCGSRGNIGPFGLINTLNRLGVGAAIVTSSEVDQDMAAHFYECFFAAVKAADPKDGITIGQAYQQAVQCLSSKLRSPTSDAKDTWGPAALKYLLVGNAGIRLCYPR